MKNAGCGGRKSLEFELGQIAEALGVAVAPESASTRVTGWSIDTRVLVPGDLFFAIQGEHLDGHIYVQAAFERGASAAIVSEAVNAAGPVLRVDDTETALQKLGQWARRKWGKRLVAVTGSAGKTTTKDVIARLLGVRLRTAKTAGNLNNHLGLPLSLLRFPEAAEVGVVELGMNHAGEIRMLASLAEPNVGVVTNVGYAHIESFGSVEEIAAAKRELIEALPGNGTAVLNHDDALVRDFRSAHRGATVTFGISAGAGVRAEDVELTPEESRFKVRGVSFASPLTGRHGVSNILAGIAVATVFGIPVNELVPAVAELRPGRMRGERQVRGGLTILNDCYNSNPDAARFMIDVLRTEPARRRIAVLGEMLELGAWSEELHRKVGEYAAISGIDIVLGIRGAASYLVEGAAAAGLARDSALFFHEPEEAGAFLREYVRPGDAILFKGSRGTHVERALSGLDC